MSKMHQFLSVVLLFLTLLAFQNCGEISTPQIKNSAIESPPLTTASVKSTRFAVNENNLAYTNDWNETIRDMAINGVKSLRLGFMPHAPWCIEQTCRYQRFLNIIEMANSNGIEVLVEVRLMEQKGVLVTT